MRQRLLVSFGLLTLAMVVPSYLWLFLQDPVIRIPRMIAVAVALLISANPLWLRVASFRAVSWMTVILLHVAVLAAVGMNSGLNGPAILGIVFLPVVTVILLGLRHGWADAFLVISLCGLIEYLDRTFGLPSVAPQGVWTYLQFMTLVLTFGFILLSVSAHTEFSARRAEETARARDAALEASRAKSSFLSIMSHELRTPMVGVLGAVELLNQSGMSPEQSELVDVLHRSATAQLELIGNVLDLSRIEAGRVEVESRPVSPSRVLADIESMFHLALHRKGVVLEIVMDKALPEWFLGDALRLRQVLGNLVGNSLKFTEQGSVTITSRVSGDTEDQRLRFEVADTGVGFDPALADEIFEVFRQGDESMTRQFGGSGLGLAICRRLVEAMGGTIGAESIPGEGSIFTFEIPAPAADPPVESPEGSTKEGPGRTLTVLLADDEEVNRFILSAMLRSLGHRTIEAVDGREALEIARSEPVDLVILDIFMPEIDGASCARELRRLPGRISSVPIIALTADAIVENQAEYLDQGIDSIYSKPIDLETLKRAIATVIVQSAARDVLSHEDA